MPLLLSKKINDNAAYAVWNIQEELDQIPNMCPDPIPSGLSPVREAEWIVGRILIQRLCEIFGLKYQGVGIRDTGKPFLKGHDAELSISHSFPMACAMIDLKKPCGIDLERPRQKLITVQDKYLHPSEFEYKGDMEKLCEIWCAKEVIFKIHGRKYLSLKDEIKVKFKDDHTMIGKILRPEEKQKFEIYYEWVWDYVLGYSV